jgi:carboxymethylenebutenolidase
VSEWVKLTASDGVELSAYIARPAGKIKGALVIVQEIFGVNSHIQSVADDWAHDGFLCIAPAVFDRFEKDVFLNYDEAGWAKAMEFYGKLDVAVAELDVDAAIDWLRNETETNVGIVGYCYGGTMAWATACRLKVEAAVGYYGGGIVNLISEAPQCPVMLHFGAADTHITPEIVAKIQFAHPEVPIFVYNDAGHAFNRSVDPKSYNAAASMLAKKRSLLFFEQHLVF